MSHENHTVLVVEDEPLLAMTLEMGLEDAGYTVVLATTGDTAIRKLEQDPDRFSAVMTDIRTPGKADGWAILGVSDSAMLPKPFSIESAVKCREQAEWEHDER